MERNPTAQLPDFHALFESAPGLYLVLDPKLTIVAATNAYLQATMTQREAVVGRHLFDVFPDNPNDDGATGVRNLKASLRRVIERREPDAMPMQKYDIQRPASQGGGFEERYWSPANYPVFAADGSMLYIIHRVEDATDFVRLNVKPETVSRTPRPVDIEPALLQRSRELDDANRRLRSANDELAVLHQHARDEKRKIAEQALHSEERFRTLADNMSQLAWMADGTGWIHWYNRRWYDYTGTDFDQMQGWGWQRVHHPDHVERVVRRWKRAHETGEPWEDTFPLRGKDGSYRWFLSRALPIKDEDGRITQWFGTNTDVTERRKAEEALRESEEQYRATFANAAVGIAHVGLDGRWVRFNDALCAITGYSRDELAAKRFADVTHPDDVAADWSQAKRLEAGDIATYAVEKRYIQKSGRLVWVQLTVSLLRNTDGTPKHFISVIEDVTERKQAAEEIAEQARLLDLSNDAIIVRRMDGRIRYWNQGAAELYGWTSADAIGRVSHELMETRFPSPLTEIHEECEKTGQWTGELRHRTKDGRWVTVLTRWVVDDARPSFVLETNTDITDRKRAEESLRELTATLEERIAQRTAALEESNGALAAFGYSVSHDLRAPLRTMQGFAKALLEDYAPALGEEGRDYAMRIARGAERMDLLIQDLLAYSRLSLADVALEPVQLDQVMTEALRLSESAFKATGAVVTIPKDLPAVLGHKATLVQVFGNLFSNAVKFVPRGVTPRLEVWAERRADRVRVFVRDNGIGIEPRHHERIFSVFERLHGSETYPGTGIGLAIVKKGIERVAGRVGVESIPGEGSTFWVEVRERPAAGGAHVC